MKTLVGGLLVLGVLLNAGAQFALKSAMVTVGPIHFSGQAWGISLQQLLINPWLWLGLFAYVVSVALWLVVLSWFDVSVAYPMLSLGYVVNAVAAHYFLSEPLSALRVSGIVVILLGVFLLMRS